MINTAKSVAATLNQHGIACDVVCEGNPDTREHGEISVKGKRAITVFVSPTDDTVYVAKWHSQGDDGHYTYSRVRRFPIALTMLRADIEDAMR